MTDTASKPFLLDAYMADLLRQPDSPEAGRLLDDLLAITLDAESRGGTARQRQRSSKALASLRATIGALVHDLLRAQLNEAAQGYCYVSSRDSSRFRGTPAAARQYMAVRDVWRDADLVDFEKGLNHGMTFPAFDGEEAVTEWFGGKHSGKAPRLRARARMIDLAAQHGIHPDNLRDHFRVAHDASYPVTLDRKPLRQRTDESDALAEKVRRINEGLERHTFDPPISPRFYAGFQKDPTRPGELVWGGRLYARSEQTGKPADENPEDERGFQQWSPGKRLLLTIDGEPVAEVDLKASHPTIYHALLGIPVPEGKDLYEVPDVPRVLVKHVVTAFFGNKNTVLDRWPKLTKKDARAEELRAARKGHKASEVARRVVDAIPALTRLSRSGLGWGELQKVEAGILLDVMDTMLRDFGIPALPVHDSLIVPERHVGTAKVALRGRFSAVTGAYPTLTIRRFDQEEEVWPTRRDP